LLTLKGRNEEKVKFSADHLKRVLEKQFQESKVQSPKSKVSPAGATLDLGPWTSDLVISGPAPAPLLRAETFYRYQIMLRTQRMSALSRELAKTLQSLALADDVTLTVDIDPVNLS
jgi:primosomal protein N'